MMAFRRHGFGGLSVKALEEATGASAGSLYNAFEDKAGLYRAAFEHYFATIVEPRLRGVRSLDGLELLFLGLFKLPMADGDGCLVTNAAIEFGAASSDASRFIARGVDTLLSASRIVLRRHMPAGAAEVHARQLVLMYQGVLVLSRAGLAAAGYRAAVRATFAQLRALASPRRKNRPRGESS